MPLGPGEREHGPVPDDAGDVHYLPLHKDHEARLLARAAAPEKPTDTGFWLRYAKRARSLLLLTVTYTFAALRHVRKILIVANKCEAADRASLAEVTKRHTKEP